MQIHQRLDKIAIPARVPLVIASLSMIYPHLGGVLPLHIEILLALLERRMKGLIRQAFLAVKILITFVLNVNCLIDYLIASLIVHPDTIPLV